MREITLDTETTGLDPASGHKVLEIGCVEMVNRIRTGKTFHAYLNPDRDVPEESFRVHGISAEFLADKPRFDEVVEKFLEFIADTPLIIHNAAFDMRFINAELEAVNREPLPMSRAVDTVHLARRKFPGAPASLDALCRRFNIDLSARSKHGALLDAELLAEVYLELTGGRQSALILQEEEVSKIVAGEEVVSAATIHAARAFPASEEELSAHAALIEKLKNPLWKRLAEEA